MNNMKPTTLNILLLRHPLDITPRTQAVPISSLSPPLIFLPTDSKFPITLLGRAIQFSQTLSPKLRNTFQNPGPTCPMELNFSGFQRVFSFTILADLLVMSSSHNRTDTESSINHNESRNVASTYYVLLVRLNTSHASSHSIFTKPHKIETTIVPFYRRAI